MPYGGNAGWKQMIWYSCVARQRNINLYLEEVGVVGRIKHVQSVAHRHIFIWLAASFLKFIIYGPPVASHMEFIQWHFGILKSTWTIPQFVRILTACSSCLSFFVSFQEKAKCTHKKGWIAFCCHSCQQNAIDTVSNLLQWNFVMNQLRYWYDKYVLLWKIRPLKYIQQISPPINTIFIIGHC